MATCWPLPRYVPAISASRSHVTTGWYSAFSRPPPMNSLLATVNVVTFLPDARLRISGSRVRRPVRKTLFTVRSPSRPAGMVRYRPACGRRVQSRRAWVAGPGGRAKGGLVRRYGVRRGDRFGGAGNDRRARRTLAAGAHQGRISDFTVTYPRHEDRVRVQRVAVSERPGPGEPGAGSEVTEPSSIFPGRRRAERGSDGTDDMPSAPSGAMVFDSGSSTSASASPATASSPATSSDLRRRRTTRPGTASGTMI